MDLTQKAAYIRGLMEGMEFDVTTKEGKLIAALLDLADGLSHALSSLTDTVQELQDKVDAIDEDLTDVEDFLFEDDLDDDDEEEDADGEAEGDLYSITCPNCGKEVCVNEKMLNDEDLCCPKCGVKWEPDFDEGGEDDAEPEADTAPDAK